MLLLWLHIRLVSGMVTEMVEGTRGRGESMTRQGRNSRDLPAKPITTKVCAADALLLHRTFISAIASNQACRSVGSTKEIGLRCMRGLPNESVPTRWIDSPA